MPDGRKHSGSQRLARGSNVGSFTVRRFIDGCPLGERYEVEAVDGGRRATAFCVSSSSTEPAVRAQLGAQMTTRTGMIHKNLVGCIESGQDQGLLYLVEEQSNSRTLVEHLERRREVSRPFDAKEAYNVIAHVANGLQYAHERGDHDQLRAGAVYIQSSGRVNGGLVRVGPRLFRRGHPRRQSRSRCVGVAHLPNGHPRAGRSWSAACNG